MCRNIKRLRRAEPPVSMAEFEEAARNLVRKLSGFREPSAANKAVFETAVEEITAHAAELFAGLQFARGQKPCVET